MISWNNIYCSPIIYVNTFPFRPGSPRRQAIQCVYFILFFSQMIQRPTCLTANPVSLSKRNQKRPANQIKQKVKVELSRRKREAVLQLALNLELLCYHILSRARNHISSCLFIRKSAKTRQGGRYQLPWAALSQLVLIQIYLFIFCSIILSELGRLEKAKCRNPGLGFTVLQHKIWRINHTITRTLVLLHRPVGCRAIDEWQSAGFKYIKN